MASTSICTCSLEGGLGLGAATAGGAIGFGFEGTVEGRTSGVSGAKVVAGDEAIDDGNPGRTMGKSEMSKTGTTGPFGTAYLFHRRWSSGQRDRWALEHNLWSGDRR